MKMIITLWQTNIEERNVPIFNRKYWNTSSNGSVSTAILLYRSVHSNQLIIPKKKRHSQITSTFSTKLQTYWLKVVLVQLLVPSVVQGTRMPPTKKRWLNQPGQTAVVADSQLGCLMPSKFLGVIKFCMSSGEQKNRKIWSWREPVQGEAAEFCRAPHGTQRKVHSCISERWKKKLFTPHSQHCAKQSWMVPHMIAGLFPGAK